MANNTQIRLPYFKQRATRLAKGRASFVKRTLQFFFWKLNLLKYSLRSFRNLRQLRAKKVRTLSFYYFKKSSKVLFCLRDAKKWRRKRRRINYLQKRYKDPILEQCFSRKLDFDVILNNKQVLAQLINKLWIGFGTLSKHNIFYLTSTTNPPPIHSWAPACKFFLDKKCVKQNYKLLNFIEKRRVNKLATFFKILGFRRNNNRPKRRLQQTKKFKCYAFYKKVTRLSSHKVTAHENNMYPLQSFRTYNSYYKMRWQALTFMLRTQSPKNLNRTDIKKIILKTHNLQKNKILSFFSQIEFTLASLLLRLRLLVTAGMADQFVKHGHVYVNYKKIIYPMFAVKPGDSISIFINPVMQVLHRFHSPVHNSRREPGLYRRNTARQSPVAYDAADMHWKTSLGDFNNIAQNMRSQLCQTVTGFIKPAGSDILHGTHNFNSHARPTAWKHGFISSSLAGTFFKQNPAIDKMANVLI